MVNSIVNKLVDANKLIDDSLEIENPALERAVKHMKELGETTGEKITSYDRMHHRHNRS
ncbi:MAG: YhhA family cyclophane-containing RiPP [Alphaproteobacteria bacterium]|jgi:hypothetical protein|nr:YhhA family cyclophane-containing RiPP [Alphaproteobacteria bacterium]